MTSNVRKATVVHVRPLVQATPYVHAARPVLCSLGRGSQTGTAGMRLRCAHA